MIFFGSGETLQRVMFPVSRAPRYMHICACVCVVVCKCECVCRASRETCTRVYMSIYMCVVVCVKCVCVRA